MPVLVRFELVWANVLYIAKICKNQPQQVCGGGREKTKTKKRHQHAVVFSMMRRDQRGVLAFVRGG
jgi:hypothetical protein